MEKTDDAIYETVIEVVTRYGMKRTTMAEIARGAGVSRQTLYERYGDKDGIMAATIDHLSQRLFADLRAALAQETSIAEKIDAYFDIAVWPTFDILQNMPDASDFEKGMGPLSTAATENVSAVKRDILAELLTQHLPADGPTPSSVAFFVEQSSGRAKMTETSRDALEGFLAVLKSSVLALCRK